MPQKLLFVIVPQSWRNRIGNENFDAHDHRIDNIVSEFANVSEAEILYI